MSLVLYCFTALCCLLFAPAGVNHNATGYEAEQSSDFKVPDGYIRFPRRTTGEDDVTTCDYCLGVRLDQLGVNPIVLDVCGDCFRCRAAGASWTIPYF